MKNLNGILLFTLLSLQISIGQNDQKVLERKIDKVFAKWNNQITPGAAVSVVKNGELIFTKGYGSANLEYEIPITENTVFHAASLSKQFTIFAILLLEEEGKLSLDDDIRNYIPEVPDFGKTITLKHLANHSSGLRDQWRLLNMAGWRQDDVMTKEHIFKLLKKQQTLNFTPGEKNNYCNTGYTLLAEVVSRVSGQNFAAFTQERIFKPLKMNNTQFYDDHQKIVKNRAYSYHEHNETFKKSILSYSNVGATSLFVTAKDFAKWAVNFKNLTVGSQALVDKMNTPPALNGEKEGKYWALGQFRGSYRGLPVLVHSGSDAGYKAYFVRLPEHDLSVVVLANVSSMNPIEQAFGIVDIFLSDHFEEDEQKEKVYYEHDPSTFISLSNVELQKFATEYWEAEEGYKRKIYVKNDTLMYYRSEGNESKLVPIAKNKFKMLDDTEKRNGNIQHQ